MNQIMKRPLKRLIWALLFVLLWFFSPALSSWAATCTVTVIQSRDQYPVGDSYPILFRLRVSKPWYIHGTKESRDGLIPTVLAFSETPGVEIKEFQFPEPEKKRFEYSKEQVDVFSGEFLVQGKLFVKEKAATGKRVITGRLSYQACSSSACLPPENVSAVFSLSIAPRGAPSEPLNQAMFDKKDRPSVLQESVPGWRLGAGLWLTLIGIFLGGLALNLTPCIYPLIPITVSYFGGRSETLRGRIFIHGLLYISGLAFTNSILGVTASLSGGMLGSVLQNPVVLIVVAGIMVFLALSFFDFWELQIPSGLTQLASKNFGGYFGTFFMGLTLGIVAAPCLGPFILGLLTYVGQKGDPLLGFLYFFVLSVGMGLPLTILATFSGALEKLPMSGEWMLWIRKLLGWVLIGMAAYLLQPLLQHPLGKKILFGAILVAAGFHLGWLDKSRGPMRAFPFIKKSAGVILICGAVISFLIVYPNRPEVQWVPYDQAVLDEAIQAKEPVILDFYADWCGPCVAMEKKVFSVPEVVELGKHFVTMRIDLTKKHPHQAELLRHYKIRGVPTIIFVNRDGIEETDLRIESYVNSNDVLKRMKMLIEKP
jgi:thiol:disulfide interchange protein DsbD